MQQCQNTLNLAMGELCEPSKDAQTAGKCARSCQPTTLSSRKARLGVVDGRVLHQCAGRSRTDRNSVSLRFPEARQRPFRDHGVKTTGYWAGRFVDLGKRLRSEEHTSELQSRGHL